MLYSALGRCTCYYIAGLLVAYYCEIPNGILLAALLLSGLLSLFCPGDKRVLRELLLVSTLISLGLFRAECQGPYHPRTAVLSEYRQGQLTISEVLKPSPYYQRYRAADYLLLIPRQVTSYLPGDQLWVRGKLQALPQPQNPGQFDYGHYLHLQGFKAQLRTDSIELLGKEYSLVLILRRKVEQLKRHTRARLALAEWNPGSQQLFMALLLGDKTDLDQELKANFKRTGLMHLLAVSGLHVGLLLLFVQRGMRLIPLLRHRRGGLRVLYFILLLSYALITGLSPSVVRAVVLFGILEIAQSRRQHTPALQALASAAFLTLLVDPASLLQLGFLMSYGAVFFILWANQIFLERPAHQVIEFLRTSLAAQLGVLPLCLFRFHQFSFSFLLSNALVLPLLGPVLAILWLQWPLVELWPTSGMAQLGDSTLQGIQQLLGWLADWAWFKEGIPFRLEEVLLLYGAFICLGFFLERGRALYGQVSLGLVICLQLTHFYLVYQESSEDYYYIPHQWRHSALVAKEGLGLRIYPIPSEDQKAVNWSWVYRDLINQKGLHELPPAVFPAGGLLFHSEEGCTTALVRLTDPPVHEEVDRVILWLQHSPPIHLDEALHHFRPDLVVADGSNASYLLPLWEESCRKQGIEFYCTQKKGAFLLKAPFE